MNHSLVNLIVAIILSIVVIFGWQHFYEKPRLEKLAKEHEIYQEQIKSRKIKSDTSAVTTLSRNEAIAQDDRVTIDSESLAGSISLKGLRFDDLVLHKYRKELDKDSGEVELFSPSGTMQSYFAEFGWWSSDSNLELPNSETIWQADKDVLKGGETVIFSWENKAGILFKIEVFLDKNYMFTIKQKTVNGSSRPISTQFYGLVNRIYDEPSDRMVNILHQGMVGTIAGELNEFTYDKIKEEKRKSFDRKDVAWLGITDKYWLSAMIPDKSMNYSSNFNYAVKGGKDKYQVDFVSNNEIIESGGEFELMHRMFAGAKNVDLLDIYASKYNIELFDRAIDFGWLYVLTKPIFKVMNFCYGYVGNFGISIMLVTVMIKILMYFPANKSYRSMKKMKKLQPKMERLREMYNDDKARLNQEIMSLYKREKVNPVSGCLPLLIQIPVFFSIYKVLYVTIEMRHAPFFGWIQDLSAPDPTTIFNLFGLLPFVPPSFLMIGIWPIFMAITMFLQQRMSPEPADPVQAKVMKLMPVMFLFMFSSFPAGLLIYWSWNNILSIVQQSLINRMDKA